PSPSSPAAEPLPAPADLAAAPVTGEAAPLSPQPSVEPAVADAAVSGLAAPASPGLAAQPVSETPAPPINTGVSPSPGVAPRLAPDYTTAIAWADNTQVKPLLVTPPNGLVAQAGPFQVVMDTGEAPCIGYNHPKVVTFAIQNRSGDPFSGR